MNAPTVKTEWNAGLYDDRHAFVFKYGEDVVRDLMPEEGEAILDLGCGTGYLSNVIASTGAIVTGIDSSKEMIEKARNSYPDLDFQVMSATDFQFDKPFDAIFSNAVLHWVKDKDAAAEMMYGNLKLNGRLVLEMGGKGNVSSIRDAVKKVLLDHSFKNNANILPWYFPSTGEYCSVLESAGFRVVKAHHFDRPTELSDSESGICEWLKMFGNAIFVNIPNDQLQHILDDVQELLRPTHYHNNKWWADYKRLRIHAIKQ